MDRKSAQKYATTSNYVLRKIADESILVPVSPQLKNRDCLFVLNATGFAIYSGIKSGLSAAEVEKMMLDSFEDASPETISTDIETLLSQMLEIEAIHVCPGN
ncbi:MAG: PqqD family protein [Deltaproteobacteria bacterium]|nr:PqqD family protein [Deltaproteobacteria bacterium]